jgi:hypothetical protein
VIRYRMRIRIDSACKIDAGSMLLELPVYDCVDETLLFGRTVVNEISRRFRKPSASLLTSRIALA